MKPFVYTICYWRKTLFDDANYKIVLLPIFVLLLSLTAHAQPPSTPPIDWAIFNAQDAGDQYTTDVATDGNGYVYTTGYFTANSCTAPSNIITNNTISNTSSSLTEDGFIAKYDNENIEQAQWIVRIGGLGNDRCMGVTTFTDGGTGFYIYVVGWYEKKATIGSMDGNTISLNAGASDQNAFIARYDQDGNLGWAYNIGRTPPVNLNINLPDYAYDVTASYNQSAGNGGIAIYVSGKTKFYNQPNPVIDFRASGNTGDIFPPSPYPANGEGKFDGFLVKYSENGTSGGTADWIRMMYSNQDDEFHSVSSSPGKVSTGGQFNLGIAGNPTMKLNIGFSNSTSSFTSAGATDIMTAQYASNGDVIWTKQMGSSSTGNENAICMAMDISGYTYVGGTYSGNTFSCSVANQEAFAAKLDLSGNIVWSNCGGSSGNDYVGGIAVDRCARHVYVAGAFDGNTFNFGSASFLPFGNSDNFFLQLDAGTGNNIAGTEQTLGGGGTDLAFSIANDRLDRVYFCSSTNSQQWNWQNNNGPQQLSWNTGGYDGVLWRYNECSWPAVSQNTIPNSGDRSAHSGITSDDCNIYCTGNMNGQITFGNIAQTSSLDASGNPYSGDIYLTRSDRFGHYNQFSIIASGDADETSKDQASDGSKIYVCGYAETTTGNLTMTVVTNSTYVLSGQKHALVVATDLAGTPQWTALGIPSPGGGDNAEALGVAVDNALNCVYVCGDFQGTVTFGSQALVSIGGQKNSFVAKYDLNGNFIWARLIESSTWGCEAAGICTVPGGGFCVTGSFFGTSTWYGSSNINIASNGSNDMYVAYYDASGAVVSVYRYGSINSDFGTRVKVDGTTAKVFASGSTGSNGLVLRCNLSTSTLTWAQVSSGATCIGNALTFDNNYVYLTGLAYPGTTFGLITFNFSPWDMPYVAKFHKNAGSALCASVWDDQDQGKGEAISQDNFSGNLYIAGEMYFGGPNFAFIHEFSPDNCDNSNRIEPPGAGDNVAESVFVYPNPGTGEFTIELTTNAEGEQPLRIFDLTGREVIKTNIAVTKGENKIPLSLKNLDAGIYLLHTGTSDQVTRLIITH